VIGKPKQLSVCFQLSLLIVMSIVSDFGSMMADCPARVLGIGTVYCEKLRIGAVKG
jgi:hypothetical protein